MEYTVKIKTNKDGWLTGQCEQLPQAISQGKDIDDLMENMNDAIETVLDYMKEEYLKKYKSNGEAKHLTIIHETKRTVKTSKRKQVYA